MTYDEVRTISGIVGLVFFVLAFAVVFWWAYNPKNKNKMNEHANIPLNEDDDR